MFHLPMVKVDPKTEARITALGGNPSLNLYQMLANHPTLLGAWIEFAYFLRKDCTTSRGLRELMILRGAQLSESEYEWAQHSIMAAQAGVPEEKIARLRSWRDSTIYSEEEQICLALTELIQENGEPSPELDREMKKHFTPSEHIELVLTASFYAMVPRVLKSLHVPEESAPGGKAANK